MKVIKLLKGYKEHAELLQALCNLEVLEYFIPEMRNKEVAYIIAETTISLVDDIIKELNLE